ncbi:MAG: MBL fold metallo-hydrolase [Anaerolineales bacterium]|nr:MBL fold metallo-hydrolase [Anaerolineales bacterium]
MGRGAYNTLHPTPHALHSPLEQLLEIQPHIYWLNGGSSNFYLAIDEGGLLLVDAGMPRREKLVWEQIAALGYRPTDLTRILVTHADVDHVGSLAAIQQATGAKVYAGKETAVLLPNGRSPKHMPWFAQIIIDTFMRYGKIPADCIEIVEHGQTLPFLGGIQVLATPGHTLDHISYFAPVSGVLFAGDALNTRNGLAATPPAISADMTAAKRSAIQLLELAPATFACGHGTPLSGHSTDTLMALFNELRQD